MISNDEITAISVLAAALIGQLGAIIGLFKKLSSLHDEVRSPNGSHTGETVHTVDEKLDNLTTDIKTLASVIVKHISDGHGSQ